MSDFDDLKENPEHGRRSHSCEPAARLRDSRNAGNMGSQCLFVLRVRDAREASR